MRVSRPIEAARLSLGALALCCLLLAPARAHAQAGLLVPTSTGRPDASVLALREMTIDVGIARGYARVNVRQVFENKTGAAQEGTYRFRLPPSASIGDFAVWDGLQRIPGVILEKQRARAIYRELTTQRIDPGLLQQGEEDAEGRPSARPSGGAAFSVRVSPIPAWATKRVLQFQQEVPVVREKGEFRLGCRLPTASRRWRLRSASAESPRRDTHPDPGRLALRPEGGHARLHGLERASRSRPRRAVGSQGRATAPCLRVPQARGNAPRRPRPRPLGAALRDPAREGRLLPARADAAGGARRHGNGPSVLGWDALPSPADRILHTAGGFRAEDIGSGHRVGLCLGE